MTPMTFVNKEKPMQLVNLICARWLALSRSERGAVTVEYILVFGCVTLGMVAALLKLGPSLLVAWGQTKTVLLSSKP